MSEPGDPSAPTPSGVDASNGAAAGDAVVDGSSAVSGFFGDEPPVAAVPAEAPVAAVPAEAPVPEAPVKASVDDLRAAVGAAPARRARISAPPARRGGRRWIAVVAALVAAAIAAVAITGWLNQRQYHLTCGAERLIPAQGRSFPPWGANALPGPAWKPILIPPQMECTSRDTDDRAELEAWFVDALGARATALMSAPTGGDPVTTAALDSADGLLTQGLLLTRSPERREQRQRLEQLRADVEYGRASAQIGQAAALLDQAAARFEKAAAQRKAADAAGRAAQAQRLAAELRAGQKGAIAPPCPLGAVGPTTSGPTTGSTGGSTTSGSTSAPAGPPLPVVPGAEAPAIPAEAVPTAPIVPIDAGMASGVLL